MASAGNFTRITDLPATQSARASVNTTITATSATDITGATVTFTVTNTSITVLIVASWDVQTTAFTSSTAFAGQVYVDGGALTGAAIWSPTANSQRVTISNSWVTTLAAGSHTLKLTGKLSAANLTIVAAADNTGMSILELTQ